MRPQSIVPVSALGVLLALGSPAPPAFADSTQILISHGLVTAAQGEGADLFFDGEFSGNGRTCGSCHPVESNQEVAAEFIATLPANDPLFVAEFPVSQGGVPGLERPALMRGFGLILENTDGFADPTVLFTMRGVPHSLSLATSIAAPADGRPQVQRTGWSGDGAPSSGALRLFAVGAVTQHFTKSLSRVENTDFVLPSSGELDDMEAFMLAVGRTNELNLTAVSLTDSRAQAGRTLFLNNAVAKCNLCHFNAGANSAFGGNANFNTGVERLLNPARAVEDFPFDGGHGATQPFDSDGDGDADSFGDGTFNTTPLIEAADTEPFFHNNAIETIEGAVAFYSGPEFNGSPGGALVGGINLTPQQNDDIGAFLRVINAAFNLDVTIQRTNAGQALENSSGGPTTESCIPNDPEPVPALTGESSATCSEIPEDPNGKRQTVDALLALANIEAADAIEVLDARDLNPTAVARLLEGIQLNQLAINENASNKRKQHMQKALEKFAAAKANLGTGLTLTMGRGNLLF